MVVEVVSRARTRSAPPTCWAQRLESRALSLAAAEEGAVAPTGRRRFRAAVFPAIGIAACRADADARSASRHASGMDHCGDHDVRLGRRARPDARTTIASLTSAPGRPPRPSMRPMPQAAARQRGSLPAPSGNFCVSSRTTRSAACWIRRSLTCSSAVSPRPMPLWIGRAMVRARLRVDRPYQAGVRTKLPECREAAVE